MKRPGKDAAGGRTKKGGGNKATGHNQLELKEDSRGRLCCFLTGQHEGEGGRINFKVVAWKENGVTMISCCKLSKCSAPNMVDELDGIMTMLTLLEKSDRQKGTSFLRNFYKVTRCNFERKEPFQRSFPKNDDEAVLNVFFSEDTIGAELLDAKGGKLWTQVIVENDRLFSREKNEFGDPKWPADVIRHILDDVENLF